MIGFALRWDAGALWITGDRLLHDGVRAAAERVAPDVVLLHLGAVRFPVTGPLHYTLTAAEAGTLCDAARPRIVVPVDYEGWKHFSQGRADVERAFAGCRSASRSGCRPRRDRRALAFGAGVCSSRPRWTPSWKDTRG